MNNVLPKLRFSHFNNKWSKRAFYSLVSRVSETTDLVDLPRVEFEDIVSGLGALNKDINNKKSDKKGIKFNSEDILFGKLRPYLKNWLFADFQGIAIGDFWVLRPNDTDGYFIYALIQGPKYQRVANLSTGTKMPRSDWKTVSETKFSVPLHIEEQQKIGKFFKQLDDRIALQQRHVEQLKQSKQGFLQKMFPKDGESVPEVRFDEYYNQWTNVRFGDITDFTTGTSKTKDINSKGKYFVMDMGSVSNTGQNIAHKKVKSSDGLLCSGDLIMPKDDIGGGFIIGRTAYIDQDNKYVLGDHVYKLSVNPEKVNSLYLHFYINTPQINIQFKRLVTGSAQLGIRSIYLCDESILIPSISEQQKIGEFFKQLDDLIAKNERELELLQETKKGFLQKMFV